MTTIGLVRHGITEWNILGRSQGLSNIPLNDLGKQQAAALANRLSLEEDKWDVIITSDLSRAAETADIIAAKLNIPDTVSTSKIREINAGQIEGTTEEERISKWGIGWRELDLGMESFEDVAKRGISFLEEAVQTYKGKRILIVSHGALIGVTLQHLLPEEFKETYIDNTSITILMHNKGNWECSLYNCTNHLS